MSDPYQTFMTYRSRDPLLHFCPLADLPLPVSPLGGAKGFSLTYNISLIFENFPGIFISPNRPLEGLEIPPYLHEFYFRFGGQPQNENFCYF